MRISSVKRVATKLMQQKQRGESTVVFLGAGASVTGGVPTAQGLIQHVLNDKELCSFINLQNSDYFEIMDHLDPGDRQRVLKHFINKSKVNITHLIVAFLMKIGVVDCVVTTNFDPLIKRSLSLLNFNYQLYDIANNVSFVGFDITSPSVLYLHGEYQNVWQYNTLAELKKKSPEIGLVLDRVGIDRTWIVIGYSGNDFVFDHLATFEKFNEGLFWIGFENEKPISKVENSLLSDTSQNTYFISGYNSDSFFKELLREIQSLEHFALGGSLQNLRSSFRNHEQFEERLEISSDSKIQLTEQCQKWIDKTILKSLEQQSKERPQNNFLQIIFDKFSDIFKENPYKNAQKLISEGNHSAALLAVNKLIQNGINGPQSYYWKGVILGLQGENEHKPEQANSLYTKMNQAFGIARRKAEDQSRKVQLLERVSPFVKSLWRAEHNKSVRFATDESLMETIDNPYKYSIKLLRNAIILQPYRPLSWGVLAQVNGILENYDEAAKAQEKFIELEENANVNSYLLLAQYYRRNNEPQNAIKMLENIRQKNPNNTQVVEILADSYSDEGESSKAIELVEGLVEKNPTNPTYHLFLGNRIYQSAITYQDKFEDNADSILTLQKRICNPVDSNKKERIQSQIDKLQEENKQLLEKNAAFTQRAVKQLNSVINNDPHNASAFNTLGIIFQNRAAILFDKRNLVIDNNQKAAQFDSQAKEQLKKSMQNYKKAVNIDPGKKKCWRHLHQIYAALGMDKKADEAKRKADI